MQGDNYARQIQGLNALNMKVRYLKACVNKFSDYYSQGITDMYNRGMLLNYTTPLKDKGLPKYNDKVQQVQQDIDTFLEKINFLTEELEELQLKAQQRTDNL